MKSFKDYLKEADSYKAMSEPSQFKKGHHRALLKKHDGSTTYLGAAHYKTSEDAAKAADHYRKNMHKPDRRLTSIMRDYEVKHAVKD